tara:strand:+ start:178 stop:312 length:135 start_codon:yes stop_codon:yes gene_type:complete
MSLQSEFNKGFHGEIPAHLKTDPKKDKPAVKKQKNIIEGKVRKK